MSTLTILHECRTLQLTQGKNALIDESDYDFVGQFKWMAQRDKHTYYARRHTHKPIRTVFNLHRVVMNAPEKTYVDHRNGDGLDNRKDNLRIVTHSQNHQNRRRSKGKSKFKCVTQRGSYWRSYICIDGKSIWLGKFPTEADAARAYDTAAREHFGEFACTNADLFGDY